MKLWDLNKEEKIQHVEYFSGIYLQNLENQILVPRQKNPKFYRCHVNDNFSDWNFCSAELQQIIILIKNVHPKLKFTTEIENDQQVSFLDVLVKKSFNKISTVDPMRS